VDTERFSAKLQVEKGLYDGKVLKAIEYEDICKVAQWDDGTSFQFQQQAIELWTLNGVMDPMY
jgi:hypothetical protein